MDTISAPGTARTGESARDPTSENRCAPMAVGAQGSREASIGSESDRPVNYTENGSVRLPPAAPWRVDPAPAEPAPAPKQLGDIASLIGPSGADWRPPTPDTTPPALRFAQVAEGFGLLLKGGVVQDGRVHRCDHRDHHKPGSKSAWYIYFSGGLIDSAVMGDWATGDRQSWSSRSDTELTPAEREEHQRRVDEARRIADAEKRSAQDLAAVQAVREYEAAEHVTEHAYLKAKDVPALGDLRQLGEALLIPMRNAAGEIRSRQTIMPMMDGTFVKDFLKDGQKAGTFFKIPGAADRVQTVEGYSTGASVHVATGDTVLVAWDASNLPAVTEIAQSLFPSATVGVAADNDWEKALEIDPRTGNPKKNAGIDAGRKAASAINGRFVAPQFPPGVSGSDWNDLARTCGMDEVRRQIAGAVAPETLPQSTPPDRPATPPGPAEKVTKLRRVDMARLRDATLAPPTYIIKPIIPRKHLTLFGAHGGSGKSTLALVLAAHVAAGRNWAGLEVERGRVLFVSFEDDEDLVLWRLRNIAEEYGIPLSELEAGIVIIDATEAEAIMILVRPRSARAECRRRIGARAITLRSG
jgi:phage/plasmid primase-like uncharacterized protein